MSLIKDKDEIIKIAHRIAKENMKYNIQINVMTYIY